MADVILPIDLIPSAVEWRLIDNSGVFSSPLSGTVRRVSRPGNRWGARLTYANLNAAKRHRLMALLSSLRGRVNSIYVPDVSTVQRGSMAAPELLSNADFSNGLTGWSLSGATGAAANGGLRIKATAALTEIDFYQSATLSNVLPYAIRSLYFAGPGSSGVSVGPAIDGGQLNNYSTSLRGYNFVSGVPTNNGSSNQFPLVVLSNAAWLAGSYFDIPFTSMARCLQVDNGLNSCLYSDQIDNAAWTKSNGSITANAGVAPDGTSTADRFTENATPTVQHYVSQSPSRANATADICGYGYFKASVAPARDIRIAVGDGGNYAYCIFNLSAGTAGSVTNVGTVTNGRAYIVSMGNSWYFCCVIGRLPSGTTTSFVEYDLVSGGSVSYTGSTGAVDFWRCGQAITAMPTRGALTTSAASTGTAQTGGALYVKGGPPSTSGALLAGDMVEITEGPSKTTTGVSQMVRLTADLDFDAAGRGYMQFEAAIRVSPADGAAVIVQKPLCKMLLANSEVGWETRPGLFSDFVLDLVEDVT